jgi:hypothetical protein
VQTPAKPRLRREFPRFRRVSLFAAEVASAGGTSGEKDGRLGLQRAPAHVSLGETDFDFLGCYEQLIR